MSGADHMTAFSFLKSTECQNEMQCVPFSAHDLFEGAQLQDECWQNI